MLHIETVGRGEPILFLHGFTGGGENWHNQRDFFSKNYTVITIDLLGHGQSPSPADPDHYRIENAAKDVIAALEKSVIKPPINLVGYSMGGRLALYLAIFYPQYFKGIILESASPGLADPAEREARRKSDDQLAARIEQNGIEPFVNEWEKLPLFATQKNLPENIRQKLRAQRLKNNPQGLANSLRGMGTGVQPSLWEKLPEIQMPVLLLAGELDKKFVEISQKMKPLIPNAKLEILPKVGHTIHLEQPQSYNQFLEMFVARLK